jgi:hypothetical protein
MCLIQTGKEFETKYDNHSFELTFYMFFEPLNVPNWHIQLGQGIYKEKVFFFRHHLKGNRHGGLTNPCWVEL